MAEEYANLEEFFETQDEEVVEDAQADDTQATGEEAEGGEEVQAEGAVEEGEEQDGEGAASASEAGESDQLQPDNEGDTGDGTTAEAGDTKPDTGINIETDDIATLRQMLREQAQEIQTLKSQSQGLNKTLVDQGTIDESDLDPGEQESGGIDDSRIPITLPLS